VQIEHTYGVDAEAPTAAGQNRKVRQNLLVRRRGTNAPMGGVKDMLKYVFVSQLLLTQAYVTLTSLIVTLSMNVVTEKIAILGREEQYKEHYDDIRI
jgi:hypothetical protein